MTTRTLRFTPLDNPGWVNKSLARAFESMEQDIPPKWLPKLENVRPGLRGISAKMRELGCGMYGCVLPTLDPKVVLKVTTDATEAEFANDLSSTLRVPIVVKYELVRQVPGKHDGREIFLLWRESADDVGKLKRGEEQVNVQHAAAQHAYDVIVSKDRAGLKLALDAWVDAVEEMANVAELEYLAKGMLRVYREQGIFFGDLHGGNLGKCMRDGKMRWIVIDPGHIAVLR